MIGYKFYWCDPIEGYKFIGMLPERRKNSERITDKSILNLGKRLVGRRAGVQNIFFIQIRKDEPAGRSFRTDSPFVNREGFEDWIDIPMTERG